MRWSSESRPARSRWYPVRGRLMAERRHNCPGRCGRTVPLHLLACGPCWWRLPDDLKSAVNLAYKSRRTNPIGHRHAVQDACQWYSQNPATPRSSAVAGSVEGA